jgi:hypothetical protein
LTVQPIDRNTPINGTLISTDTDLVINGDVDGIAMIIAPNNTIDFRTTDSEYNKVQSIDGIYIANKITSSTKIFNGNLGNTTWASK